jgi:fatty-acyl-CoA synthase
VVIQYATARIGAILVNINPAYRTTELEYALRQSGVSLLVLARAFRQADYVRMLGEVRRACPDLREALVLEDGWESLVRDGRSLGEDVLAAVESTLQFDEPINIQYTSGTTGFPKGATLSHHNILNNGFFIGETLRYTSDDRVCIPVPFYHCFGMVLGNLACTTHGACIVVPGEAFDPDVTLRVTEEERCTALYGVPTMFIAELGHAGFDRHDLSRLRTGIMAGSPCPVEVMKKVQSRMNMREVTICYGMTETSPVSTQSALDDPLEKRVGTVGRVHPHVEVKVIVPETGAIVQRGDSGELCTRGYSVTRWMHTGDLATMDADGYVNIVGRIKDMIIRGGENIYPREIEEFLYAHPDVSDVQVIGIPSERYGEEVMAWVKPREGATPTVASLEGFCRGRISTNKIPRYWKFVDSFPMTVTGKVQKYLMREASVEELGLQAAASVTTA